MLFVFLSRQSYPVLCLYDILVYCVAHPSCLVEDGTPPLQETRMKMEFIHPNLGRYIGTALIGASLVAALLFIIWKLVLWYKTFQLEV